MSTGPDGLVGHAGAPVEPDQLHAESTDSTPHRYLQFARCDTPRSACEVRLPGRDVRGSRRLAELAELG